MRIRNCITKFINACLFFRFPGAIQEKRITISATSLRCYLSGDNRLPSHLLAWLLLELGSASHGEWATTENPRMQKHPLLRLGQASQGKWAATGYRGVHGYLLLDEHQHSF